MIIKGKVEEWTSDYDQIAIDDRVLGDSWDWDEFEGKKVFVRYFVSDAPIEDVESATEGWLQTLFGALESDAYPIMGSEWTGQYGFEQTLVVGGHDLLEEMRSHVGKYVLIEVNCEDDDSEG